MTGDMQAVWDFWTKNLNGLKFLESFPGTADQFWSASEFRYKYHHHLPPLFDRISLSHPGAELLEVGCGMGDDTAQWAKRGLSVTAVDLTEPAVECTKFRFKVCGLNGNILMGNAESLEFPDNSFDIVYSFGVLHHSPDTYKAIEEVRRLLRAGGLALIMLYHRRSLNYLVHRVLNYPFDGSRKDPCPVEHTYAKPEIMEMFKSYSSCKISVEYLFGTGYGIVNMITPMFLHRFLGKRIGWHLIIEAVK
jgi:ubiquinone/menaquinone biosynthesis C-methylase UbiE